MKLKKISGTAILNGNVIDSLEDNSTTNAPSQRAVNDVISGIVESGSNSNGSYIKFSDGTLICRKAVTVNASMKAWFGSLWYDDLSMGNWSHSFVDTNGPIVNATINNNQYWLASCAYYNQTSAGTCRILRMNELNQSVTFNIIGFGRWK